MIGRRRPNRDVVMFMCGRLDADAKDACRQLVRQAPAWLDVALVGHAPDGSRVRHRLGLRRHEHRLYDARELTSFGFPAKATVPPEAFRLIPGNTDLIHLRFAADHPHYDRYWWVEDDVRFGGDWADLFEHLRTSDAGLLGTSVRRPADDPEWRWWADVISDGADPVCAFLPFGAVSREAVTAITTAYAAGWSGHYEVVWPSAVLAAGLRVQDVGGSGEFVPPGDEERFYTNSGTGKLAPGTFVWRPYHDDYDRSSGKMWHPVRREPGGVHAT